MIAESGLTLPALDHLAMIIRAADTDSHDRAPEAAGLLAASLGQSRMHRDDLAPPDAALPDAALPDDVALNLWCRNAVDKGHDRPAGAGA